MKHGDGDAIDDRAVIRSGGQSKTGKPSEYHSNSTHVS